MVGHGWCGFAPCHHLLWWMAQDVIGQPGDARFQARRVTPAIDDTGKEEEADTARKSQQSRYGSRLGSADRNGCCQQQDQEDGNPRKPPRAGGKGQQRPAACPERSIRQI